MAIMFFSVPGGYLSKPVSVAEGEVMLMIFVLLIMRLLNIQRLMFWGLLQNSLNLVNLSSCDLPSKTVELISASHLCYSYGGISYTCSRIILVRVRARVTNQPLLAQCREGANKVIRGCFF